MNFFLRDMNLDEPVNDDRRIEVVANGLSLWHGVQVAVDTTLVSPLRRDGSARTRAAQVPGRALQVARRRKCRYTYPEVVRARRCRLLVFGLEVGGRWSPDALEFLQKLARARAREAPLLLRGSVVHALLYRWSGLVAVAAQRAFASSLLELPLLGESCVDGALPSHSDLCADARWTATLEASRLPLRE